MARAVEDYRRYPGDAGIILAEWQQGDRIEYVTWKYHYQDGIIHTYWGHYSRKLDEALSDFEERQ
jgi:hypothetical protein